MYKVENYPQIKDHFYLTYRNQGASLKLLGKVAILTVFMHCDPDDWSEETKNYYHKALYDSRDFLRREAEHYEAGLEIKLYSFDVNAPSDCDSHDGFALIKDHFKKYTMNELQSAYEKSLGVDEAIFLLAFDKEERCFAVNQREDVPVQEISVVFTKNKDNMKRLSHNISHEILHQFGAVDYYFPAEVKKQAERYFKYSVMGIGSRDLVDSLTAYLVGWKDTVDADAWWFLKNTMWLTKDIFLKELKELWRAEGRDY